MKNLTTMSGKTKGVRKVNKETNKGSVRRRAAGTMNRLKRAAVDEQRRKGLDLTPRGLRIAPAK